MILVFKGSRALKGRLEIPGQRVIPDLKGRRPPRDCRGQQGPVGLQGPIGDTGPKGEAGPHGPQGEKGDPGVSGAEIRIQTSNPSSSDKTLTVRCDGGKIAIGGGARVLGAAGLGDTDIPAGVAIVASYPNGVTGEKSPCVDCNGQGGQRRVR